MGQHPSGSSEPPAASGMDLCGTWLAAPGDDDLRRRFAEPGFDDAGWAELVVPGHWRSAPGFETSDGPVLHRRPFEAPPPEAGRRSFVVLDGCFYQGDVWLDGSYLGDTDGYFLPHAFEVTEMLGARREHVLAVELACAPQPDPSRKRNLTGAFQRPATVGPDWNPGGIWRPVRLVQTGPVRITSLRMRCTEATAPRACLHVTVALDAAQAGDVRLRTTVVPAAGRGGPEVEHLHRLQVTAGVNEVSWRVDVAEPALWWPRALAGAGAPPSLVDVEVEASVDGSGAGPSDVARRRTGLRQVRMRRWVLEVNGERMFVKATGMGPTAPALGEAAPADIRRDVDLAQEAGLDLVRLHAHISRPELYEAADAAGLLLWQDLPLEGGGYTRSVLPLAVHQATAAVDLLAHHPSIALWCAQDEPFPGPAGGVGWRQVLPSWNRTVLGPAVARALERADGSRPVVGHSGGLPGPFGGSETRTGFGWYHGDERDLPKWLRRLPALARFVGQFGAQSVPETAAWMEADRWPDLDWDRLVRSGMEKAIFDLRLPTEAHASFESWRAATQEHQATLIRHHVEALRRLKYRPTGGFWHVLLADTHPAVSGSVLDHERVPKAGFAALRDACAPVLVTADRPDPWYRPGAPVALDVHVVSDLREPLEGCTLRAELAWPGGSHRWGFVGDVPADAVQHVGTLSFVVPEAAGTLTLDLRLSGPVPAASSYTSEIVPVH